MQWLIDVKVSELPRGTALRGLRTDNYAAPLTLTWARFVNAATAQHAR
jgi:hypothetical protein